MCKKRLPPIHPGEILREEFMKPLNLSANALAQRLGVTTARHYGRYRFAVSALFFHDTGILDESSAAI